MESITGVCVCVMTVELTEERAAPKAYFGRNTGTIFSVAITIFLATMVILAGANGMLGAMVFLMALSMIVLYIFAYRPLVLR